MKTSLIFLALYLAAAALTAQTRNPGLDIMRTNIWRFGGFSFTIPGVGPPGLDFSSGSPVVFNCGDKPVGRGATAISDTAGNMLLSEGVMLLKFNSSSGIFYNNIALGVDSTIICLALSPDNNDN